MRRQVGKQLNALEVLHLIAELKGWRVRLISEVVRKGYQDEHSHPCTLEVTDRRDDELVARVDLDRLSVNGGAQFILAEMERVRLIP